MITIINKGGPVDGVCKYRLQINNKLITEFTHSRPDGLATCLRKAAEAVEAEAVMQIIQALKK